MFVRSNSPKYYAPASINVLTDGGKLVVNKFDCQFKRHTKSQLKDLDERIKGWPADDVSIRDRSVLEEVLVGWRAVQDADGKDMAFSMAAVDELEEENPGFIRACVESFYLSTQPRESAHLASKN